MKRLFALIAVFGIIAFGVTNNLNAQQDDTPAAQDTTKPAPGDTILPDTLVQPSFEDIEVTDEEGDVPIHQQLKTKFIEGGAGFMGFVLLALIFGLALSIERIIYLSLAQTNSEKLLLKVEETVNSEGIEAAKELCRNTRGPVASIFYQGLDRYDQGIEVVEKTIISYGSVQMGLLEKGLTWISLFISIAPMLGFMGTVIGMIKAFDTIQTAGEISASLVAGGIKIALITTVSGLVVAIILQIFYNYILSKIDNIVTDMEDSSISLMDIIVKYNLKK